MKREFNVTGICIPDMHYMVDISEKVEKIFQMVEDESYFIIKRGRQYGKTTTISRIEDRINKEGSYVCVSICFQYDDDQMFADEEGFCQGLLKLIHRALSIGQKEEAKLWADESVRDLFKLDDFLCERCTGKKIVLIIDEADEAYNYEIFVRFMKMLRAKFLSRTAGEDYTFHSFILAEVGERGMQNRECRMQNGESDMEERYRKQLYWNIASDFKIDMSFSAKEIETMLVEYENDYHTGMNISEIAQKIRFYTNGYPYLVSRVCLLIEEELDRNWTIEGVKEAIQLILKENSALFSVLIKKMEENREFSNLLYDLAVGRRRYPCNVHYPVMALGLMFGFLARDTQGLVIHNRIFEMRIADYFVAMNLSQSHEKETAQSSASEIIIDNVFDMEKCLTKFKKHYAEIYTEKDLKFLENDGILIFLIYLKPLINDRGFCHFEPQSRDHDRIDLIVDFLRQQFIIEIKPWYGDKNHEEAYTQLVGYLKSKNIDHGYLLTFDFRKKPDERFADCQWVDYDGKRIFDVVLSVGTL